MVVDMRAIVWGAELFAEHLAAASSRLGVSPFSLALLLASAIAARYPRSTLPPTRPSSAHMCLVT